MTDEDGDSVDPEEAIKQLADVVIEWHQSRLNQIDEILASDSNGKGIKICQDDGSEIIIEGDKLAGFRAGLHVAKLILGKLPFTLEGPDDDPEKEVVTEPKPEPPVRPAEFGHFS